MDVIVLCTGLGQGINKPPSPALLLLKSASSLDSILRFSSLDLPSTMIFLCFTLLLAAIAAAQYDYIIVGGGTSGLAVANRLSEDPKTSVLVIEAGSSVFDNINVTDIDRLKYTYDSSIDWAYQTTPQSYGGNTQVLRAGQALGGTSVMNGR